jgi:hypothetical protein
MFASGHFSLAAKLAAGSPGDVVRWASGATLRPPVLDARPEFAQLATRSPCGGPYRCSSPGGLSVISMRPATAELPTSRGLAQVPAWLFRVAQLPWAFTERAVAARALVALPFVLHLEVSNLLAVSRDGRQLTLTAPAGFCSGQPKPRVTARVYETASAVVIGARITYAPDHLAVCAGVELTVPFRATLARPLGSRAVLDAGSGQPLPWASSKC